MLLEKLYGTLSRLYRTGHRFFNAVRMHTVKVFDQLRETCNVLHQAGRSGIYELFPVLHILTECLMRGPVFDLVLFALHRAVRSRRTWIRPTLTQNLTLRQPAQTL